MECPHIKDDEGKHIQCDRMPIGGIVYCVTMCPEYTMYKKLGVVTYTYARKIGELCTHHNGA